VGRFQVSDDPVSQIEDAQGQRNLGEIGARLFEGAREEGLSRIDALFVVAGWFLAVLKTNDTEPTP
jgi:hypothetical protein